MKKSLKTFTLGMAAFAFLTGAQLSYADTVQNQPITGVPISANISHNSTVTITTKDISTESPELHVKMGIPVVSGMRDTKYQGQLNDIIERHAMEDLEHAKAEAKKAAEKATSAGLAVRPYQLIVKAEVKANGGSLNEDRISFTVTTYLATGGTGSPRVDTYNVIDSSEAKLVKLEDLLGDNYKTIVNQEIEAQIAENADHYFKGEQGFKGISDTQSFYIEGNEVVIVFPKYSIAPGSTGTPEFRIAIGQDLIGEPVQPKHPAIVLTAEQVYKNESGTMMIPLRLVAEHQGFKVEWKEANRSVELSKAAQWTTVYEGKDSFFRNKMAPVSLGGAAMNNGGTLYVPVKFAIEILLADVVLGEQGTISIQ